MLAISRDWRSGDILHEQGQIAVENSSPQYTGRIEWSPAGMKDVKRSDAHFGVGQHLTFGVYGALQESISFLDAQSRLRDERRYLYGVDVSFHRQRLNLQMEVNGWKIGPSASALEKSTLGYVVQAGYYLTDTEVEPALRYEVFDGNRMLSDAEVTRATLGLNKYFDGHRLKMMINFEHSEFGKNSHFLRPAGETSSNAVRLTFQFIL